MTVKAEATPVKTVTRASAEAAGQGQGQGLRRSRRRRTEAGGQGRYEAGGQGRRPAGRASRASARDLFTRLQITKALGGSVFTVRPPASTSPASTTSSRTPAWAPFAPAAAGAAGALRKHVVEPVGAGRGAHGRRARDFQARGPGALRVRGQVCARAGRRDSSNARERGGIFSAPASSSPPHRFVPRARRRVHRRPAYVELRPSSSPTTGPLRAPARGPLVSKSDLSRAAAVARLRPACALHRDLPARPLFPILPERPPRDDIDLLIHDVRKP